MDTHCHGSPIQFLSKPPMGGLISISIRPTFRNIHTFSTRNNHKFQQHVPLTFITIPWLPRLTPVANPRETAMDQRRLFLTTQQYRRRIHSIHRPLYMRSSQPPTNNNSNSKNKNTSSNFLSDFISQVIYVFITSISTSVTDLQVQVDSDSIRQLLDGKIIGIKVYCSQIVFQGIRISRGSQIYARSIDVELPIDFNAVISKPWNVFSKSFIDSVLNPGKPKLVRPFPVDFSATLTEEDLNTSVPIKEGIKELLDELIRVGVGSMFGSLLPRPGDGMTTTLRKISVVGAKASPEPNYPSRDDSTLRLNADVIIDEDLKVFNIDVRMGLAVAESGTMLAVLRPELVINVFGRRIAVPFLLVSVLGISLGPDLKIQELQVSSDDIKVRGMLVVRPQPNAMSGSARPPTEPRRPPKIRKLPRGKDQLSF